MNDSPVEPRLVTVTGPLSGEVLSLGASEVSFGRELENTVERVSVLESSPEILPEDLGEPLSEADCGPRRAAAIARFHDAVVETKKKIVLDAFRASSGSYTEAARALGLHPKYLYRLVSNLGIEPPTSGAN